MRHEFKDIFQKNKTPIVVSVGCFAPCKHNGVLSEFGKIRETGKMCHVMRIDEQVTCMGWFNLLMTEFIVACVAGYYFFPIHIPFSTSATQAKFIVASGRKDGVDLVLIYRYVVIFLARFG